MLHLILWDVSITCLYHHVGSDASVALQARPATKAPEHEEDEEEKEEEEKDLSVPGPSYVKLMALTPGPVLPGTELSSVTAGRRGHFRIRVPSFGKYSKSIV